VIAVLTILGAPRTKKNSGRIVKIGGSPRMLPSAAFKAYEKVAVPQLRQQWRRGALCSPVNIRATFYRDALRGDAVGYYQALADVLEAAGVVEDDKWIVSWDGSRLGKDAGRPRVEVVIDAVAGEAGEP